MVHTIPEGAGSATCMGAVGPTLRLVDAFYMENGRTIEDPNSGYIEARFRQPRTANTTTSAAWI
ncbi:MAG: hypothetical protein ACLVJK_09785 [Alistipes putredinis]